MTRQKIFQVDAFANQVFSGNPAAVLVMDAFPSDDTMQSLAMENNLAETAFTVKRDDGEYDLRWFTPNAEVDLCGHATLATTHTLYTEYNVQRDSIIFNTRVGKLHVNNPAPNQYTLDLPAANNHQSSDDITATYIDQIEQATGHRPSQIITDTFLVAIYDDEKKIREMKPNIGIIEKLDFAADKGNLLVTAKSNEATLDFVSRYFAPGIAIPEDPVTGAAHCMLAPYWANVLGKSKLRGYQASPRGGYVDCQINGDRVILSGSAVTYMRGEISI